MGWDTFPHDTPWLASHEHMYNQIITRKRVDWPDEYL